MKSVVSKVSAVIARRRSALLALALLVVVTHTITTSRLCTSLRPTIVGPAPSMQMHAAQEARQRALDDAALRASILSNTTLAPDVLNRLLEREQVLQCLEERDYGMVPLIREEARTLCDHATGVDPALGKLSTYKYYSSARANIMSTLVTNLWVDLRSAQVFKPIFDVSQDGGRHDPRFKHDTVDAYCVCSANQDQSLPGGERVWGYTHGGHSWGDKDNWQYCKAIQTPSQIKELQSGFSTQPWTTSPSEKGTSLQTPPDARGWPYHVHEVKRNAIIMGRRDDHNPFFQIAAAMNAWIMLQVLDWSPETTQLVYFDDGLPATTDELQRRVLAPNHPVVKGRDIMGSVLHFENALVAPFEYMTDDGPP
jgi:glycoprotein 2-beta-D-xylosyltransferase